MLNNIPTLEALRILASRQMYLIDDENIVHRVSFNSAPLGNADEILGAALSDSQEASMPFIRGFPAPDLIAAIDKGSSLIIAKQIDHISIECFWAPMSSNTEDGTFIVPVFTHRGSTEDEHAEALSTVQRYNWNTRMHRGNNPCKAFLVDTGSKQYIACVDKHGLLYKPPLPNIYGDGRLCLGEHYTNKLAETPVNQYKDRMDLLEEAFQKGSYNSDLLEDDTDRRSKVAFRYDLAREEWAASVTATPWTDYFIRFSNTKLLWLSQLR